VLRAAGVSYANGFVDVSSLPKIAKNGYVLILRVRVSGPQSEMLSGLL
jgi:hypothetical protein